MKTKRLDKKVIQTLEPKEKRYEVRDSEVKGLALRVNPNGTMAWVLIRWIDGRMIRHRIAAYPEMSVKNARSRGRILNGEIELGRNPAKERRAARAEMTLAELWEQYLEHSKTFKKSWRNDELQFNKHLAKWKSRKISEIRRVDVAKLMARIGKLKGRAGGPVAANRVKALLSSMYSWAEERGVELINPTRKVRSFSETPRDRYLSPEEVKDLWEALENDKDQNTTADIVRLLLLTGQRSANVRKMRWDEIDLKRSVWVIPADQAKSGKEIRAPLAPEVVNILKARRSPEVWVFPAKRSAGPVRSFRHGFDRLMDAAGIQDFTPHDLRRTFATWMSASGIGIEVVGAALGHAPQGLTGQVYAHVQLPAVKQAVERTVRAILAATQGTGSVVQFPAEIGRGS
jgi:integrase